MLDFTTTLYSILSLFFSTLTTYQIFSGYIANFLIFGINKVADTGLNTAQKVGIFLSHVSRKCTQINSKTIPHC